MNHHPLRGAAWMVTAGVAFALVNASNQWLGLRMGLVATQVAFWQYTIALMLLLPWWLMQQPPVWRTRQPLQHLLRVVLAVAGIQCWTWALVRGVPIWQAIALVMTSPLFATVGSALLLGEKVDAARWLATTAGFAGAMLILAPWQDDFSLYSLLPVIAAFFWAGYSLMVKAISRQDAPQTIVFWLFVLMLPFNALLNREHMTLPGAESVGLLLATGLLTAVAQQAIARAYAAADAAFVQPFDYVKLPLNVLAGWLVFGWVPPGRLWLGAAIIVGSSWWLMHREQHRPPGGNPKATPSSNHR